LIKAALRFDEKRGFKFISYAVWWIRQSIMQALAEQARIVRLPLNRIATLSKIIKTFSELEQKFQREPSNAEIAQLMGVTTEEISETLHVSGRQVSMDAPFSEGEEGSLLDVLNDANESSPEQQLLSDSLTDDVERALATLPNREAEVMRMFFGLGNREALTLEEIGSVLGLSQERVRQLKERATRKLKHSSRSTALKSHVGWD
jgi:RNA polymerase primary sigma factor